MTDIGRSRRRAAVPATSNGAANGRTMDLRRRQGPTPSAGASELAVAVAEPEAERDGVRLGLELDQLRAERARLLEAKEELAATLEERTRRAQQLLGERAQLEVRLRERDEQIQRLNRELGAASRPPQEAPRRPARLQLGTRLAALAGRLAARPKGVEKIAKPPMPSPLPAAGWDAPLQPFMKEGAPRPLIAVIALGLGRDELSGVLEFVSRYGRERGMRPLLLTDDDGVEAFRARRMVFEYLPPGPSRHRHAPDLDWDLYLQRRLALLRRKWQPARVVAFGAQAASVARLWRGSPFEDESIKELIGTVDDTAIL